MGEQLFVPPLSVYTEVSGVARLGCSLLIRNAGAGLPEWSQAPPLRYPPGVFPSLRYIPMDSSSPTAGGYLQSHLWLTKASPDGIVKTSGGRPVRV